MKKGIRLHQPSSPNPPGELDTLEEIARDVSAVSKIEAVPTLLEVLCDTTGMRFAAVARVTESTWTACVVKDDIDFGLKPGDQLDLESTLCIESKRSNEAVVIEHASVDPRYCSHHTPRIYKIESYVSVPIVLANGRYFGNLCAIDPAPAKVADPKIINMFTRFAALIAMQLEGEMTRQQDQTALRNARAANELREQFIAILGHRQSRGTWVRPLYLFSNRARPRRHPVRDIQRRARHAFHRTITARFQSS
jgi:GAF domain-containing protein